jgi:hypothetical protein
VKEEKVENMDEIDLSRISFSNEQQKRQAPTWQSDSFKELLQQQIKEVLKMTSTGQGSELGNLIQAQVQEIVEQERSLYSLNKTSENS